MARDYWAYTIPYHGWYWCHVSRIEYPHSWNATVHLVHLPIATEIITLCGWKQKALELYTHKGKGVIHPPEWTQCAHCQSFWVRRVLDRKTKYDDIPNEYQALEGGE